MKTQWKYATLLLLFSGLVYAQPSDLVFTQPATQPVTQPAKQPATQPIIPQQLTFFDSKLFDAKLSQELRSGKNRIEVEVTGRVPLSNIPDRIDRWVTKVGEEGKVEVKQSEPAMRTRSLFGIIPMIFESFKRMQEERMLEPAGNFDAVIYYRKDASGDTLIDRVVFTRKKAE